MRCESLDASYDGAVFAVFAPSRLYFPSCLRPAPLRPSPRRQWARRNSFDVWSSYKPQGARAGPRVRDDRSFTPPPPFSPRRGETLKWQKGILQACLVNPSVWPRQSSKLQEYGNPLPSHAKGAVISRRGLERASVPRAWVWLGLAALHRHSGWPHAGFPALPRCAHSFKLQVRGASSGPFIPRVPVRNVAFFLSLDARAGNPGGHPDLRGSPLHRCDAISDDPGTVPAC